MIIIMVMIMIMMMMTTIIIQVVVIIRDLSEISRGGWGGGEIGILNLGSEMR